MDYDQDNNSRGLSKGPFYGAAAFIFAVLSLFVSVVLKDEGTLGHWQIATCILGSGLIATLLFIPHFLEGFVERLIEKLSQQESDLTSKAFYELKEIRTDIDALTLKLDKVPTLVNKIVSDLLLNGSQPNSSGIIDQLNNLENKLHSRLERIEESAMNPPSLLDPDPSLSNLEKDVRLIHEQINLLREKLESLPSPEEKNNLSAAKVPPSKDESDQEENVVEEQELPPPFGEEIEQEDKLNPSDEEPFIAETSPEPKEEKPEEESVEDAEEETTLLGEEIDQETFTASLGVSEGSPETTEPVNLEDPPTSPSENDQPIENEQDTQPVPDELDLGLPDPQETLRKVDALLAGEDIAVKTDQEDPKKEKNGTTTVVANVMIGIGNKPYLRGEGPGLSWDEGVSMNFIEIGKWAWSPPRKNASLTVQVYRNDQDPDKGGKTEVKAGQKLEITPDFS